VGGGVLISRLFARLWGNAWLLLCCTTTFWAGNAIIGRAVAGLVPPATLSFWRWTGAFCIVLGFAWEHLRADWPVVKRHWRMMLLLSATGIACFNVMLYTGLQTTTALNGVLMRSSQPLLVILWAVLLLREIPTGRQIVGVAVSLAGVAAIASHGDVGSLARLTLNPGDVWILGGCVIYALYTALLRWRPKMHPLSFLAVTFFIGAVMILPVMLMERADGQVITGGVPAYLALGYTMIFPSLLAYLCFNRGVELIGPSRAGQSSHLVPVFGVLLAVVLLGERFYGYHALGIVLIGTGILLASLAPGQPLWPAVRGMLARGR